MPCLSLEKPHWGKHEIWHSLVSIIVLSAFLQEKPYGKKTEEHVHGYATPDGTERTDISWKYLIHWNHCSFCHCVEDF